MSGSSSSEVQWCFSQVKGTLDDDVTEADIISCVEFNQDGDLLATGDKGGRVVIFQRDPQVRCRKGLGRDSQEFWFLKRLFYTKKKLQNITKS
jgi:hypothetical protein